MDIDNEISRYKIKIKNIEKTIAEIKKAIVKYQEANELLKKIKNVTMCDDLKQDISNKVTNLNALINKMRKEIESSRFQISSLNQQKIKELNSETGDV